MTKRWGYLVQVLVLLVVAALVAAAVVRVRRDPTAAVAPLQIGIAAPSLAIAGDTIPVDITVGGPAGLQRIELTVDGAVVEGADLGGETAASVVLEWPATDAGSFAVGATVFDDAGNSARSNTATVLVGAATPILHIVDQPGGSTLGEIADQAGIDRERLLAADPGADLGGHLPNGSFVLLPPPWHAAEPPEGSPASGDGPSIEDGVLHVDEPVDGLFLYLTTGDQVVRVPPDPHELMPGGDGEVALDEHLPPLLGERTAVEVWGRRGGEVAHLGDLTVDAASLLVPATSLDAILDLGFTTIPVKSLSATDEDTVELRWASSIPHHGVRWFLSRTKPNSATALAPVGVLQNGLAVADSNHSFQIDMADSHVPNVLPQPAGSFPLTDAGLGSLGGGSEPGARPLPPTDPPGTTWAWVIPVDTAGSPVGPPSDPVRIIVTEAPFDPADAPPWDVVSIDVGIPPAQNPALEGCVRIVSEHPPFPNGRFGSFYLNTDGSTTPKGVGGVKMTGALPYQLGPDGVARYPFTACPGETQSFQWGDVGCAAYDIPCQLAKGAQWLGDAAVAFGEFLVDLANGVAEAYADLKAWAIDVVASALCPDEVAAECKKLIEVGVDVLLTSVGVPPTLPDFDDLADAAKGELVDLALDQLGVGSACDAIAGGAVGKTCGELAADLDELGACSLAPKGQEANCQDLVEQAAAVCAQGTAATECTTLTMSARDVVEEGMARAYDESVEAIEEQISKASLSSIGFAAMASTTPHACHWGGIGGDTLICPAPLGYAFGGDPPTGCHVGQFSVDAGKLVCSYPPPSIVATPEPLGMHQPMRIDVLLERNDNPLPPGFACGPISAVATTVTPHGAVGQPYLPASAPLPGAVDFFGQELIHLTLWLSEPNPHAVIPTEKRPHQAAEVTESNGIGTTQQVLNAVGPGYDWEFLLEGGSYVGVTVSGQCIPETNADGPFGVAGQIPTPLPRITPGEAE